MNRSAAISLITGVLVLVISISLPYFGGGHFLWFTINGATAFGKSGVLYLISPLAMPVVLIMWYGAVKGFQYGYQARSSENPDAWYNRMGFYLGIANFIVLGWNTIILPILSWVNTGYNTGIM